MEAFPGHEHVLCGQTRRCSQAKALHSEKLKAYFEEHPDDKRALQRSRSRNCRLICSVASHRMQRALRERKSVRQHLKSAAD